jgi:pyruvate kinase
MSPQQKVVDRLSLAWGVRAMKIPMVHTFEELIATGERVLLEGGLIRPGETVVVLGGNSPSAGSTSFVKFHVVSGPI